MSICLSRKAKQIMTSKIYLKTTFKFKTTAWDTFDCSFLHVTTKKEKCKKLASLERRRGQRQPSHHSLGLVFLYARTPDRIGWVRQSTLTPLEKSTVRSKPSLQIKRPIYTGRIPITIKRLCHNLLLLETMPLSLNSFCVSLTETIFFLLKMSYRFDVSFLSLPEKMELKSSLNISRKISKN